MGKQLAESVETLPFFPCFYYSSAISVLPPPLHSFFVYFSSYGAGHMHPLIGNHAFFFSLFASAVLQMLTGRQTYAHTSTTKFRVNCGDDDTKWYIHTRMAIWFQGLKNTT